jgi:tetratricopeptide (TPR) repeat protein
MSLLLDARKKSQQVTSAQDENASQSRSDLSLQPLPQSGAAAPVRSSSSDQERSTGQNLFSAKTNSPAIARAGINRYVLIALAGTILFLAVGAVYVWHAISDNRPSRPIRPPANPVLAISPPRSDLVPGIAPIVPSEAPKPAPRPSHRPRARTEPRPPLAPKSGPILVEDHREEPIYPLLKDAYAAYGNGKLEEAEQLYQKSYNLDHNNLDAILGLGAVAQRRGDNGLAKHYYSQALEVDPRNAVANAGMSSLAEDDKLESRLKTLLNGQPDSPALNFALGNHYAEEGRWGDAQEAYFNAYRLEPGNPELAFNLAVSLDRLGQEKTAVQYYQRALELDAGGHAGFDHAQISQRIESLTR